MNQLFFTRKGVGHRGRRTPGNFCQVIVKLSRNVGPATSYINITLMRRPHLLISTLAALYCIYSSLHWLHFIAFTQLYTGCTLLCSVDIAQVYDVTKNESNCIPSFHGNLVKVTRRSPEWLVNKTMSIQTYSLSFGG